MPEPAVALNPKAEQAVDAYVESRLAARRRSYQAAKSSKLACEVYEEETGIELPQLRPFVRDGRHYVIRLWASMEEIDPEQEGQNGE